MCGTSLGSSWAEKAATRLQAESHQKILVPWQRAQATRTVRLATSLALLQIQVLIRGKMWGLVHLDLRPPQERVDWAMTWRLGWWTYLTMMVGSRPEQMATATKIFMEPVVAVHPLLVEAKGMKYRT
jgi:hypothetical protein